MTKNPDFIAKCKYCGIEPIFQAPKKTLGQYKIHCPRCRRYETALNESRVTEFWNSNNTNQHGQQLYEKKLLFTEWDGDVEHLPPINKQMVAITESSGLVAGKLVTFQEYPEARIIYYIYSSCGDMGDAQLIHKGDLFAVVE